MGFPGSAAKLEVVRGSAFRVTYWPRRDGKKLTPVEPALIGIFDHAGADITPDPAPVAAVNGDSIVFTWTPDAKLTLAEDYRYVVEYRTAPAPGGDVYRDEVWFDLVRVGLECPVDDSVLEGLEPDLPKWLAARQLADARPFILLAWDDVIARIRAAGFRPALITDRHAFVRPAAHRALSLLATTLISQPGDKWDRKREIHADEYDSSWAAIGRLKFVLDPEANAPQKTAGTTPRFTV